jgi:hypothetical protein
MPCPTPECPADQASAPRRFHADFCPRASSRSGKSGGRPPVRTNTAIADELRRIAAENLEDEALVALKTVRR